MKGLLEEGCRRGAARGDRREGVEGECALLDDQVHVNAARALGAIVLAKQGHQLAIHVVWRVVIRRTAVLGGGGE